MTDTTARQLASVRAERDALLAGITEYRRTLDDDPFLTWRGGVVSADLRTLVEVARGAAEQIPAAADPAAKPAWLLEEMTLPSVEDVKAAAEKVPDLIEKVTPAVALGVAAVRRHLRK
ncbi:hypothetical protein [Curtobacterium sp. MCSS17_016]|uniref:hypothetical protein n=1 Tax=Curtobacterium sp. MCSS17_016 TaxID=2175644 RepID=UPI000DAA4151|nr:hypothetical protein [Curtobacterium sp. MCSS17_016]WIE81261.1 hypothetical protein DEJ19_018685 [Curtobacterium sp. MCSS17_016]